MYGIKDLFFSIDKAMIFIVVVTSYYVIIIVGYYGSIVEVRKPRKINVSTIYVVFIVKKRETRRHHTNIPSSTRTSVGLSGGRVHTYKTYSGY
jgi:hypothetical protein